MPEKNTTGCVIVGVGQTRFSRRASQSATDLGANAVVAAIEDAGIARDAIDVAFSGNVMGVGGGQYIETSLGQGVMRVLGMSGIPIVNVSNACATGGSALREAVAWIVSGAADTALVLGLEIMSAGPGGVLRADPDSVTGALGVPMPALYALRATKYLNESDATVADLASVSVKNRRNGALNANATYQLPVTVDEVLQSTMIADPITKLQCSANADGAAALVVCSGDAAKRLGCSHPITLAGIGMVSGRPIDLTGTERDSTERAAAMAFAQAGIGPDEIDVCELHDAFSIAEVLHCESLGFAPKGTAARRIATGEMDIEGGHVAVNPSGGLLSRGHPLAATGVAQVVEIVHQLRGTAGARQRANAKVGLSHIMGGTIPQIDSDACVVSIFHR